MVLIRNYKDSDFEGVNKNIQEGGLYNPDRDSRENLKKKIGRNPGSILVAVEDGQVVGNVYMIEDSWASYIMRLAVRKKYWKKGIGTLLVKHAEKKLKKRGAKAVALFINIARDNLKELKKFYEKCGYKHEETDFCMYKKL